MKRSGSITGVLFLALAIAAFYEALKLPFGLVSAPQPGFFPAILSVLLAAAALLVLAEAFTAGQERAAVQEQVSWKRIGLAVGALIAFALLFESLGYVVATFLFVVFLLRAVDRTTWRLAVGVAFCAALFSYLLFGLLLRSPLPVGPLGF
jgi:putative tricarboxylic transport membrane protein